ncbi:FKBP-type peptidyl-prolyl cis-trans isomerase [Sphingobacterium kitahiroshimense]|uniref:peptidylprolyl isomerase n=1 Tax=Sphingobacterium kitahiroshimense TaxID=470446 RepID=A0ABV0BSC9_9SPHI
MKNFTKIFFGMLAMIIALASCSKNDDNYFDANKQFELEAQSIKTFVSSKLPLAVLDTNSGIWYQMISEGDGVYQYIAKDSTIYGQTKKVPVAPKISVRYTGQLLDGTVFDQNQSQEGMTGFLTQYIPAWQIAFFPKKIGDLNLGGLTVKGLSKGTKIRIITPSYWAYQNMSNGKIPSNSPLDFMIEVVDIK